MADVLQLEHVSLWGSGDVDMIGSLLARYARL